MAESTLSTDSFFPDNNANLDEHPPAPAAITGLQCRAARAMLDWSREDLGERTGIHYITLCNFELGHCALKPSIAQLLRLTFAAAGVLLIDDDEGGGPGVCLARPPR